MKFEEGSKMRARLQVLFPIQILQIPQILHTYLNNNIQAMQPSSTENDSAFGIMNRNLKLSFHEDSQNSKI